MGMAGTQLHCHSLTVCKLRAVSDLGGGAWAMGEETTAVVEIQPD